MSKQKIHDMAQIIPHAYHEFWRDKRRYVAIKGSRGSGKSYTAALYIIFHMMKHAHSNTLVIRAKDNTHKDSTFALLNRVIDQLGLTALFKTTKKPLEITNVRTGQKILFKGLDDAMKLTSITVQKGILNFVWVEEAYELKHEDEFNKLDLSIRGILPEGHFFRILLTFNPWSAEHWLKERFFDAQDPNIMALTTKYSDNPYLQKEFTDLIEALPERRKRVEAYGEWGISEGLIFEDIEKWGLNTKDLESCVRVHGLDFGFSDETALVEAYIDFKKMIIYITREHYQSNMLPTHMAQVIRDWKIQGERIIADSARPEIIFSLQSEYHIRKIVPCEKGPGSIIAGVKDLQRFKILVAENCKNAWAELNNYTFDPARPEKTLGKDHLIDALRYGIQYEMKKFKISASYNDIDQKRYGEMKAARNKIYDDDF